jgi:hypothetical protein
VICAFIHQRGDLGAGFIFAFIRERKNQKAAILGWKVGCAFIRERKIKKRPSLAALLDKE